MHTGLPFCPLGFSSPPSLSHLIRCPSPGGFFMSSASHPISADRRSASSYFCLILIFLFTWWYFIYLCTQDGGAIFCVLVYDLAMYCIGCLLFQATLIPSLGIEARCMRSSFIFPFWFKSYRFAVREALKRIAQSKLEQPIAFKKP